MKTKAELVQIAEMAKQNAQELISNGDHLDWNIPVEKTLQETISTSEGGKEFVEKTTYDVYRGRENVELLYGAIYQSDTNANYPRLLTERNLGAVQLVFVKVAEFEGVRFGRLSAGESKAVEFFTYAAGIEITEDMIEYNETWDISEVAVAFGENYNKLLNHIHMDPILSGSYTTTGGGIDAQKDAQEADTPQLIAFDTDVKTTLRNALSVLPMGTAVIANPSDKHIIEDAIFGDLYNDNLTPGSVRRAISPENIVYYDGSTVEVGDKVVEYAGVEAGFLYMVVPRRQYRERIKHDLRLDQIDPDLKNLIAGGTVGRSRRAVSAALGGKYGAIKVDIKA